MKHGIAIDMFLSVVETALTNEESGEKVDLTSDVGALVRDKGMHVGLGAAELRQRMGFLNDVANCSEFIMPPYRRRLKR